MSQGSFWNDPRRAQEKAKALAGLKEQVEFWGDLESEIGDLEELFQLIVADKSGDLEKELDQKYRNLEKKYEQARLITFFKDQYDDHEAIVSIHGGAGGLDAQDWAEMLLRMYLRFAEMKGLKPTLIEKNQNPEGGIKSATFEIKGRYAYGYFQGEAGVHRLIRLSPFNPTHTRETSFALVEVLPILESYEDFTLDPKDLKIEARTSRGHGGQSVNTTYSAIRITHIPTNITVSIQNERSQTQNKEQALKILKSRVKKVEEEKNLKEKLLLRGEFKSAEWGNQIRSYTIHPYKLVKDHRTGFETSDVDSVLAGKIDDFIEKYLEYKVKK